MSRGWKWPFALRSTLDMLRLENHTLRDALRNNNDELRRHRVLIAAIKRGAGETYEKFERIVQGGP